MNRPALVATLRSRPIIVLISILPLAAGVQVVGRTTAAAAVSLVLLAGLFALAFTLQYRRTTLHLTRQEQAAQAAADAAKAHRRMASLRQREARLADIRASRSGRQSVPAA